MQSPSTKLLKKSAEFPRGPACRIKTARGRVWVQYLFNFGAIFGVRISDSRVDSGDVWTTFSQKRRRLVMNKEAVICVLNCNAYFRFLGCPGAYGCPYQYSAMIVCLALSDV